MDATFYTSPAWQATAAAVLRRDGNACVVARLLGGCSASLHVHHIIPASECADPYDPENCVTVCSRHHPMLDALRRHLLRPPVTGGCRHFHRTEAARLECDRLHAGVNIAA
jgi:5-methylcytosine-specific restriction endonuclease McrA